MVGALVQAVVFDFVWAVVKAVAWGVLAALALALTPKNDDLKWAALVASVAAAQVGLALALAAPSQVLPSAKAGCTAPQSQSSCHSKALSS